AAGRYPIRIGRAGPPATAAAVAILPPVATTVVKRRTLLSGGFRRSGDPVGTLVALMARADPGASFGERLHWLAELTRWVVRPGVASDESGTRAPRDARLRLLLGVLDRNPAWKVAVARTVRATVREIDALEVFTETGLPREGALLREA